MRRELGDKSYSMKYHKFIIIAAFTALSSVKLPTMAQDTLRRLPVIETEETVEKTEKPDLERDVTIPHIIFRHESYGKPYLKGSAIDKVVSMSLQCEGDTYNLDYKGKFQFRDPQIEPKKGLKVVIRNISDYARADAAWDIGTARAYTAWRDYKRDEYSEKFKFDKKKKQKDNHLYIERQAAQHKFHYIVYQGGMDKDDLIYAFLEKSEEANVAAALNAFDNVIASGTFESNTFHKQLSFNYTQEETSTEEIDTNQKTIRTKTKCGGFTMKDETKKGNIYPIGSQAGMQSCVKHRTRPITVNSTAKESMFDSDWFRYKFKKRDRDPSYEAYRQAGFIERNAKLYYHENSAEVPYRTREQAFKHCRKYY